MSAIWNGMAVIGLLFCIVLCIGGIVGMAWYTYLKIIIFKKELQALQAYREQFRQGVEEAEQILAMKYNQFAKVVEQTSYAIDQKYQDLFYGSEVPPSCSMFQDSHPQQPVVDMNTEQFFENLQKDLDAMEEEMDWDDDDAGEEWKKGKK